MANGTWKIARGKGSPQLSLAIMAILAVLLVVLGRAQSVFFDRARTYFSDTTSPALKVIRGPSNVAARWFDGIGGVLNLYKENIRLRQENADLRQWQNAALILQQRLKRYQLLLNAVPDPSLMAVTAHVIGHANRPFLDTIVLDAGKDQGLKPGEAVVDDRGMIGRVYLVGQRTAWVILLTDLSSKVPVSIEPGHIPAILSGANSSFPGLELSQQGVVLRLGQQIVTSGDGGLLPAGLPVGNVTWDGSSFRASLLADGSRADDVRVVELKTLPEQPPAPGAGDLPVSAAGLSPMAPPARTAPVGETGNRNPVAVPGAPTATPPQPAAPAGTPADEQDR